MMIPACIAQISNLNCKRHFQLLPSVEFYFPLFEVKQIINRTSVIVVVVVMADVGSVLSVASFILILIITLNPFHLLLHLFFVVLLLSPCQAFQIPIVDLQGG